MIKAFCQHCGFHQLKSLPLLLMKATVLAESYNYLYIFIVICLLQWCLLTVARYVSLSCLLVNIFFYHFTSPGFPFVLIFPPHGRRREEDCNNHGGTKWWTSWKVGVWKKIWHLGIFPPKNMRYTCIINNHQPTY